MKTVNHKLSILYKEMDKIAIAEVQRLARVALIKNPKHFKEFVMCMGTFFFTDLKGDIWRTPE